MVATYRGPLVGGPTGWGYGYWPDPYLVRVLKDGTQTEYEHIAGPDQPHPERQVYGWWVAIPTSGGE